MPWLKRRLRYQPTKRRCRPEPTRTVTWKSHARTPPPTEGLAAATLLTRRRQRTLGPQPCGVLGQRLDQRSDCCDLRLHIDPQPEFGCCFRCFGTDARDDGPGMRLACYADQVAHRRTRREAHRVEPTRLDHLAGMRRWRCRTDRAIGGDVLDLPAAITQTLGQRLG